MVQISIINVARIPHNLDACQPTQVKNGKEYPINWIKISGDKKEDYEYDFRYYHRDYSDIIIQ